MRDVSIVGAGIAGLTTALCLAKAGFSVTLFEQAADIRPVGAGIQLSPNALRVMDRLGCREALAGRGTIARSVVLRDGESGRQLAQVPVAAADGTPYLSIHRADLQEVLLEAAMRQTAIRLYTGQRLDGLRQDGGKVVMQVEAAARRDTHETDLLIAADGVRSTIAAGLGFAPPVASPYAAWRFLLSARPGDAANSGIEAWLSAGWHAVTYPVHHGRTINLVVIARTDRASPTDASPEALLAAIPEAAAPLIHLMTQGHFVGCWRMSTAPVERPYCAPRHIALVGDAAHGMLPFAAQGAAMGIEDAAVLAACLADGAPGALQRYEALRRPRLAQVLARVRFHDRVYHLPRPLSVARDTVMRLTPQARLAASLGWLYDWVPPEFDAAAFETTQKKTS